MRQAPWLIVIFLFLVFLAGCTSLRPQTGDVSFRLLWSGKADLDLHVRDPRGGHVGLPLLQAASVDRERYAALVAEWQAKEEPLDGKTAGVLDIDCNADPARFCREPMENIFWPVGEAPRGEYRMWVELFQDPEKKAAIPYVLEIRRGAEVVQRIAGSVGQEQRRSPSSAYAY